MIKLENKKSLCATSIAHCVDIILSNHHKGEITAEAIALYKALSQKIMPYLRNEEKAENAVNDIIKNIAELSKKSPSLVMDVNKTLSDALKLSLEEGFVISASFLASAHIRFLSKSAKDEYEIVDENTEESDVAKEVEEVEDIQEFGTNSDNDDIAEIETESTMRSRLKVLKELLGCPKYKDIPKQLDFIYEILDFKVPEFIGDTACQKLTTDLGIDITDLDYDAIQYAVYRIFKKTKLADLYSYYEVHSKSKLEQLQEQYAGVDPESFVDNPSHLAKKERANFVKGLQKYTLETLILTKEFLESHNLRFYLTEGTLLGAVRHQGFIPWDDDIDIAMPRADYDKLVQLAEEGLVPPELNFDALENNPNHWVLGAKMQLVRQTPYIQHKVTKLSKCNGPYVDIFPLEYWSRPAGFKYCIVSMTQKLCRRMLFMKTGYSTSTKKMPIRRLIKLILPFVSNRSIEKLAIKNMKKFYKGNRKYLVNLCSYYPYYKEVFPRGFYGDPVYIDFEGHKMPVPCEYDSILKTVYGRSYDTIPPVKVTKMRKHAFDLRDDVIS